MKLAFIGGCLNNQQGLERSSLYHSLLKEKLADAFPSNGISISLGYYTSYNRLQGQAINLISVKSPDIVFLFLRPFPLMALNKLWIKFDNGSGKLKREFHPALFHRKNMDWPPILTNYTLDDATIEPRREKFGLRDVNLMAGLLTGLNQWAVKYILHQVKVIQQFCELNHKQLVILSLPKNPESLVGDYICSLTNKKIKAHLRADSFIEISHMGEKYFEPDGIHYNAEGHRLLAEIVFGYIMTNKR